MVYRPRVLCYKYIPPACLCYKYIPPLYEYFFISLFLSFSCYSETKKWKYKSRSIFIPEFIARRFRSNSSRHNNHQEQQSAAEIVDVMSGDTERGTASVQSTLSPAMPPGSKLTTHSNGVFCVSNYTESTCNSTTLPVTNYTYLSSSIGLPKLNYSLQPASCNHHQRFHEHQQYNSDRSSNRPPFRFHSCPFHNKRKAIAMAGSVRTIERAPTTNGIQQHGDSNVAQLHTEVKTTDPNTLCGEQTHTNNIEQSNYFRRGHSCIDTREFLKKENASCYNCTNKSKSTNDLQEQLQTITKNKKQSNSFHQSCIDTRQNIKENLNCYNCSTNASRLMGVSQHSSKNNALYKSKSFSDLQEQLQTIVRIENNFSDANSLI